MTMIPRSLKERLHDGQVIPFVGAGVSMAARRPDGTALFPSWRDLLLRGADRLAEEGKPPDADLVRALLAVDDADYLAAAKRLRDKLDAVWIPFLKEQLDPSSNHVDAASLALARAVWALGSKLILTTNYDCVLAWACPDPLRDDLALWDVEAVAEQAQLLRDGAAQKPTVWHLHGRIDNAARLVLTPDGYRRLYPLDGDHESQYRAALMALRHLLAARSLLFIGFSLDDACFGVELRGVGEVFEGCAGPHYALVHERDAERLRAQKVPVELLTFEDFGPPLVGLVERLGRIAGGSADVEPQLSAAVSATSSASPFGDQGRITDPERFFDREEILERIFEELAAGRNVSLVGEAQVGKSSVLAQVCARGPERMGRPAADFVYLDMQELSGDEDFFAALSEELGLAGVQGWRLRRALGDRRVVLCLDELEKMTYSGFTREVRSQLRGLADGNQAPLTLLLASRSPLAELLPDSPLDTSPLAPTCPEMRLAPFSRAIARRFLRRRMAAFGRRFSEAAQERLLNESGGHPGRLQAFAHLSYRRAGGIEEG